MNGWKRLGIVLVGSWSVLWVPITVALFLGGDAHWGVGLIFWLVPCALVYAFGYAAAWVRAGFTVTSRTDARNDRASA